MLDKGNQVDVIYTDFFIYTDFPKAFDRLGIIWCISLALLYLFQ